MNGRRQNKGNICSGGNGDGKRHGSFMETDILYHNGITYEQGKNEMVKILMKGIQK